MTERASFIDMLTYGFRTLFWRPIHAVIFVAATSAIMIAYYSWAQSEAGMDFFFGYAGSIEALAAGDASGYFEFMGQMLLLSLGVAALY